MSEPSLRTRLDKAILLLSWSVLIGTVSFVRFAVSQDAPTTDFLSIGIVRSMTGSSSVGFWVLTVISVLVLMCLLNLP